MAIDTALRLVKYALVAGGLAATVTMCSSPKRVYDCYSGARTAAQAWQDLPEQTKYDFMERTLLQMPDKDLYAMAGRVFYTRIKGSVESRTDDVLVMLRRHYGGAK